MPERQRVAKECWKEGKEAVISNTFVPLFKLPCLCAWNCLCCNYAQAGKEASLWVWQCVQFWTPLSFTLLFLWLLYRPDRFHPSVDSAVLATLSISSDSSLRYDLTVDLSFRNSNRLLSIRYLDIGATASYNGTKLGPADNPLPGSFRQGPKNTTVLHTAFQGTVTGVEEGVAKELQREQAAGTIHVRVTVDLTIEYKVIVKQEAFNSYDCYLPFTPQKDGVFHSDNNAMCIRV